MWFLLLRERNDNESVARPAEDEDTAVLEPLRDPFVDIPDVPGHDDDVAAISSIILATLAAQKAFVSVDTGELPDKARDNFSIGYVGGYVDAVLRRKRLQGDDEDQFVAEYVFSGVFGNGDGHRLFERYTQLRDAHDAAVIAGITVGESDIETWVKNNLNVPFGWSVYVHDCTGHA